MTLLVWIGTAVALAGLVGILACIGVVQGARRQGLDDEALRARLRQVVTWNLAAFFVAMIGLILLVLGLILG